jgi:phosphoribosylformylglycinamidine cyclo-ligase
MISSKYNNRGVSSTKDDVHKAISNLSSGISQKTFCKVYPDYLTGSISHYLVSHADGAGTKSVIAYLYWKETGDLGVWKNIAQDAIVMNTDDLLCVGVVDNMCFTSTIGRNKNLITGDVISSIINGTQKIFDHFEKFGSKIHFMGGETADVGDVVKTIIVDGTMTSRISKSKLIDNRNIQAGDVIIGFSSSGQSVYESEYNSGIGSNGLTSARHDLLNKSYMNYTESFDENIPDNLLFTGKYSLQDIDSETGLSIGKLLLSPTRTYLPIIKEVFSKVPQSEIHGLIHCSGGGQTKVLNFIDNLHIVKDNLFSTPSIFKLIQNQGDTDWKEMYQVFNMGHRLEMYVNSDFADRIIKISKNWGVDAKVIGKVYESDQKKLIINSNYGQFIYL